MHKHLLEFCRLTGELLESEPVRMMGRWQHHGRITTLDHSLFVAYLSFRAARWLQVRPPRQPVLRPPQGRSPECRAGDQALR